jgi:hypothetical protein
MKNLTILLLLLTFNLSAVTFDKVLKVESNDLSINEIRLARYKTLIGFKVQEFYYFTDKENFAATINNEDYLSEWKIYINTNGKYLKCFNKVADIITQESWFDREGEITIIIYPDKENILMHIRLTFKRGEL